MKENITSKERSYLRDLAKQQLEYANLEIMHTRKERWYKHNKCQEEQPLIVMEMRTFRNDFLPSPKCESPAARSIEMSLLTHILNHERIDDDKVVPDYFEVERGAWFKLFDLDRKIEHAKDQAGRNLGYAEEHPIKDLEKDLPKLGKTIYGSNREQATQTKAIVNDVLGDILPVAFVNSSLNWVGPTHMVINLMGMEQYMMAMYDCPEAVHQLMQRIQNDFLEYVSWQAKEGLLCLNNGNHYAGAGSYGFTHELPSDSSKKTGQICSKDLWLNINSQETVGVSPDMYHEFVFPYYRNICEQFGLVYYGCCEPVHDYWVDSVSNYPNLRKVSISPWCNEEIMGEKLRGSNVIYSRKPSPNYIGVGQLDETAFRNHIKTTLKAATDCHIEFIFRDIYALDGDISKPGKAVRIVRDLI